MKKSLLTALAATFILFSCEKDDTSSEPPSTPSTASEYYPLSTGSYWIYDLYVIDTNGVESLVNSNDSLFVAGDTLIQGETFKHLVTDNQNSLLERIQRDSSGYLVNVSGSILFAPDDFSYPLGTDVLSTGSDTIYTAEWGMKQFNQPLTVPAGTFDVLMLERNYLIRESDSTKAERQFGDYRARNVGLVAFQYGQTSNKSTYEYRLVRYQIQ